MMSGQMWNHIRGPPYAHRNPQTGEIVSNWGDFATDKNILGFLYDTNFNLFIFSQTPIVQLIYFYKFFF